MSKLEPGQRAYEAYHGVAEFSMRVLTASERRRWAAVEQACAVPASELNDKARVELADSLVGEVLGYLFDRGALDKAFATWGASMHQEVRRELTGKVADALGAQAGKVPAPSATPSKSEGEWVSVYANQLRDLAAARPGEYGSSDYYHGKLFGLQQALALLMKVAPVPKATDAT